MKLSLWWISFAAIIISTVSATNQVIHENGYCAMYGDCGKKSVFGSSLPCPSYSSAVKPEQDTIELLYSICGTDFDTSQICCNKNQLESMKTSLKRVDPLISSCPACHKNFYNFICKFTCSPNQATFINITKTEKAYDTGNDIVTELTQYIDPNAAEEFYDSCKNVKFSATNGYAMDLIGGGAKNYQEFLKFLGDEKPFLGGSPFQVNYAYNLTEDESNAGLKLRSDDMKPCNDKTFKCACSDCEQSCPKLSYFSSFKNTCKVGVLPCFSFSILIIWIVLILLLGAYHMYIFKFKSEHSEDDDDIDVEINPLTYVTIKSKINYFHNYHIKLIDNIQNAFGIIGFFCSSFPGIIIGSTLILSLGLSGGLYKLNFETNPINLWVSPQEPALKNLEYFESSFGEWFRIEQIIVSSKNDSEPILNWDTVQWWFAKEQELQTINNHTTLNDICFKPLDTSCGIQSFTQYFYGDITHLDENNWKSQIENCANSPVNCLPSFQQPLQKNILFDRDNILEARAFTVTLLINSNSSNIEYTNKTIDYEHSLQKWAHDLGRKNPHLNIAYSTEISLTEELNKSTNTDIRIIIISYLVMFIYASLALGGKLPTTNLKSLVRTRFLLGLVGIFIILLSVTSSLGFFSYIGLKSTLIIAEVIPFLVLAIGIDNIFLIVHELHLVSETFPYAPLERRISQTLKNIGPSCLISAVLQVAMFLLATRVDMPAVKNFAFYSAGAVLINFILQMTCFVSVLTLDQRRLESNRIDCFPFIQLDGPISLPHEDEFVNNDNNNNNDNENNNDNDIETLSDHYEYNFSKLISKYYAPFILSKTNKPKILTLFVVWLGISLGLLPTVPLGLDQRIAIPHDSYLINYFDSVYNYLNVGPPVFFVVKDSDVTQRHVQKQICGKFSGCDEYSLANILEQEYKRSSISSIAEPSSNWLDDFLSWLNPDLDLCCRVKKVPTSPLEHEREFCSPRTPTRQCTACYESHDPPYDSFMNGFPTDGEFMNYFNNWIEQPSDPCPLGGKAPYYNSILRTNTSIDASYFRTGHEPLRSQDDFINAYKNSIRIVDEIKKYQPDLNIFAFSPFYVFFVQYATIIKDTFSLLGIALLTIWIVSSILLGSFRTATVMTIVVLSILINIGGVLALWSISLNAVSLVNLIICAGIAVEFTIHLSRAYVISKVSLFEDENISGNEDEYFEEFMNSGVATRNADDLKANLKLLKSFNALSSVGGSVLSGVTLTKIIGISVLAFTRSKIFEVYYFRMWISLVFIAAIHGLCLLPILLSYFGDDHRSTITFDNDLQGSESQLGNRFDAYTDE
ncbi:patched family-domain-containing protein [Scheffersomyces amazonensis]|uniref:patched family-domain-containing protein n=1 Tax=Scheffersomyces amazonensis TaxID=1078765 RepID=UPI00315CDF4F